MLLKNKNSNFSLNTYVMGRIVLCYPPKFTYVEILAPDPSEYGLFENKLVEDLCGQMEVGWASNLI